MPKVSDFFETVSGAPALQTHDKKVVEDSRNLITDTHIIENINLTMGPRVVCHRIVILTV